MDLKSGFHFNEKTANENATATFAWAQIVLLWRFYNNVNFANEITFKWTQFLFLRWFLY